VPGGEVQRVLLLVRRGILARVLRVGELHPRPGRRLAVRGEGEGRRGRVDRWPREIDVEGEIGEAREHEAALALHPLRIERAIQRVRLTAAATERVDRIDL